MLIDCPKCNQSTLDECTANHIICLNEDCSASYKLERKPWRTIEQSTTHEVVVPPTVDESLSIISPNNSDSTRF